MMIIMIIIIMMITIMILTIMIAIIRRGRRAPLRAVCALAPRLARRAHAGHEQRGPPSALYFFYEY